MANLIFPLSRPPVTPPISKEGFNLECEPFLPFPPTTSCNVRTGLTLSPSYAQLVDGFTVAQRRKSSTGTPQQRQQQAAAAWGLGPGRPPE